MTLIEIPFNDWSIEKLKQKKKTCTCRTKKYGNIGDIFIVDGIKYVLIYIGKTSLGFVHKFFWGLEGAKSPEEFIDIWNIIHPIKKYNPDTIIWFHHFRRLE